MRLKPIEIREWSLYAVCDERGGCRLMDFLSDLKAADPAEAERVAALLRRVAGAGPPRNKETSRRLHSGARRGRAGETIFELKPAGAVRILYFYDEGRVIVCFRGMLKPKRTELAAVVRQAAETRGRYFRDKAQSRILIVEE